MSDIKEHMFRVPLSSHRTLHLQTEKTNLNHSVHLHAASVGCFRMKINMHTEGAGIQWHTEQAGSTAGEQQRRMDRATETLPKTSQTQTQFSGTLPACKCWYKGYLSLQQITAAHTEVGKTQLQSDLYLMPRWLQRPHLGPAASRNVSCTLPNTHKTADFIKNWSSKSKTREVKSSQTSNQAHFMQLLLIMKQRHLGGYFLKCELQQKASVMSWLLTPSYRLHPH